MFFLCNILPFLFATEGCFQITLFSKQISERAAPVSPGHTATVISDAQRASLPTVGLLHISVTSSGLGNQTEIMCDVITERLLMGRAVEVCWEGEGVKMWPEPKLQGVISCRPGGGLRSLRVFLKKQCSATPFFFFSLVLWEFSLLYFFSLSSSE